MPVPATVRFRRTAIAIDEPDERPTSGMRLDIALFAYMTYSVVDHFT